MTESTSTLYGVPVKYVSLVILIFQNSALVLTMRYSRTMPGVRYISSTAVVCSEMLKCMICLLMHLRELYTKPKVQDTPVLIANSPTPPNGLRQVFSDIFGVKSGFPKLLVPAVLYTLQNNLQFVAASNLDAATFQVTYQGKILTTALFSVILLQRQLSWEKWFSLVILTAGVACVQIPVSGPSQKDYQGNYMVGIMAVAIACMCSGFAGVYFEKVLKGSQTSIWVRNVQLSVGCLAIAVMGTLAWDGGKIAQDGFFQGYNTITIITILMQAAGGLIVAMVIKFADNILKGFATSISIILSTVASIFMFNFIVSVYFTFGTVLVCFATYLYGKPDLPKPVLYDEERPNPDVPLLVVEDFDERQLEEKDANLVDAEQYNTTSDDIEEARGYSNVSPSLLQNAGFDYKDEKDMDEFTLVR